MRTVVCVKQVRTLGDEVELTADGRDVDPDYVDLALNEWDAYATEEALRLRETHGGEVVVVTCGDGQSEAALRRCLAMGADRAIRVEEAARHDPIGTAHALFGAIGELEPDLVLCGVQSSDAVQAATPTALAALLGLPCVAVVTGLELGDGAARVQRELEGGLIDVVDVDLPALLTIQTGINAPRYVNLRAIKQAEQREIAVSVASPRASASSVRRMFVPERAGTAEMLGTDPAVVAERIAAIVKERLS